MAFFGLTDIKFNNIEKRDFGPLAALEGSKFKNTTLRYPTDLGRAENGHYMVFFIREQKNTSFKVTDRGGSTFAAKDEQAIYDGLKNAKDFKGGGVGSGKTSFADTINSKLTNMISSGTSALTNKFGKGGVAGKVSGAIDGFVKGPQPQEQLKEQPSTSIETSIKAITDKNAKVFGGLLKRTQLTTDAIALYMPNTMNFDSSAAYSEVKPGEEILGQLMAAAPNLVNEYKNGGFKGLSNAALKSGLFQQAAKELFPKIASSAVGRLGLYAASGGVTNPMLELIYTTPELRSFQFEFFFYPRSEAEAYEVQKIIERFRFHQAPELQGGLDSQMGLLIPPSEFDIKFFYAGRQNPNIPPIATCVLKQVQVNFAPNGFTAYETVGENNPALGRTGMPIAIQMTLMFQETTYITKEDFNIASGSSMQSQAAYSGSGGKAKFS